MIDNTTFLNKYRVRSGPLASLDLVGMNGAFMLRFNGQSLAVVASDGSDWDLERLSHLVWEHVSVSCDGRTPTWHEMCYIKGLFWHPDDCVVEFHPSRKNYVNYHPFVLHMWKPIGIDIPMPPAVCVGPKGVA